MVHARTAVGDLLERDADQVAQVDHGPVHGVAQAEHLQGRRDRAEVPDVHRHRVGVVEQPGVRADLEHVAGQVTEEGEGAQATEHAADAEGVRDRLPDAEPFRDVEVGERGRVPADRHGVDHEVRAVERGAAVGARDHLGRRAVLPDGGPGDRLGQGEPTRVEVVQHDPGGGQGGFRQQVAEQLPGELDRAGADETDHRAGRQMRGGHRRIVHRLSPMCKDEQQSRSLLLF
jgi:hypothetical protein